MTITKKISEDFTGSGFAELEFRMSGFSTSRKPLEQNAALLLPQLDPTINQSGANPKPRFIRGYTPQSTPNPPLLRR